MAVSPGSEAVVPRRKSGCFGYMSVLGSLLVLASGYLAYSPAAVPVDSLLVSAKENTYLTIELTNHGEGFSDPSQTVDIYYTHLGGWFESSEKKLVCSEPYFPLGPDEKVQLTKKRAAAFAPITISIPTYDMAKGRVRIYREFTPQPHAFSPDKALSAGESVALPYQLRPSLPDH